MSNTLRGLVHILVGLCISVLVFFISKPIVLFILGLATLALLSVDLLRFQIRWLHTWFQSVFRIFLRDYESSRMLGASYMFVGSLVSVTVFTREVAVLAISFLAVGDVLATLIGTRFGRIKLFKKNLEGILACLVGCLIVGFTWRYIGLGVSSWAIVTGIIGAAVAESLPRPVDDNLTIPLISGLVMTLVGLFLG